MYIDFSLCVFRESNLISTVFIQCISRIVEGRFIFAIRQGRSMTGREIDRHDAPPGGFLRCARPGVRHHGQSLPSGCVKCLKPRPLSQSEVLERIEALYGPQRVRALQKQLARFSEQPDGAELCQSPAGTLSQAHE